MEIVAVKDKLDLDEVVVSGNLAGDDGELLPVVTDEDRQHRGNLRRDVIGIFVIKHYCFETLFLLKISSLSKA